MKPQALRFVAGAQPLHWISGHGGRWWNLGQGPPVRPPESQRPIGRSIQVIPVLVHHAMVPTAQQREIR